MNSVHQSFRTFRATSQDETAAPGRIADDLPVAGSYEWSLHVNMENIAGPVSESKAGCLDWPSACSDRKIQSTRGHTARVLTPVTGITGAFNKPCMIILRHRNFPDREGFEPIERRRAGLGKPLVLEAKSRIRLADVKPPMNADTRRSLCAARSSFTFQSVSVHSKEIERCSMDLSAV
jgi:hypothetical protein